MLLIAFNRSEQTLIQAQRILEMGHPLFVSIDGPRNARDLNAQGEIIRGISEFDSHYRNRLKLRVNEKNMGLANSIYLAIDWAFQFTTKLVILEDDIDFNANFFDFATASLRRYGSNDDVLMISGNQFFEGERPENQVTSYPLIWGWATTKSKWTTMKQLAHLELPPRQRGIPFKCYAYWKLGFLRVSSGELNSWVLPIAAQMRLGNYFSVCPSSNLTSNIGDDELATHTTKKSKGLRTAISLEPLDNQNLNFNKTSCSKIDKLIESKIYEIKSRCIVSLIIYKLMQNLGFKKC